MKNLLKAMAEFQDAVPDIKYDQEVRYKSTHFKYASLRQIYRTIKPTLRSFGLLTYHYLDGDKLITVLRHIESGEFLTSTVRIPESTNPQDLGKWITYTKRYSLTGLLGIVSEEDDDGNVTKEANKKPIPRAELKKKIDAAKDKAQIRKIWGDIRHEYGKDPELFAYCSKKGKEIDG